MYRNKTTVNSSSTEGTVYKKSGLNENWQLSEEDGADIVRNTGDFLQLSKRDVYKRQVKDGVREIIISIRH